MSDPICANCAYEVNEVNEVIVEASEKPPLPTGLPPRKARPLTGNRTGGN